MSPKGNPNKWLHGFIFPFSFDLAGWEENSYKTGATQSRKNPSGDVQSLPLSWPLFTPLGLIKQGKSHGIQRFWQWAHRDVFQSKCWAINNGSGTGLEWMDLSPLQLWRQKRLGFQCIPSNPRFFRNNLVFEAFFSRLTSEVGCLFPKIPHHPIPPKIPTSGLAVLWELWDNCGMWEQPPNPAPKWSPWKSLLHHSWVYSWAFPNFSSNTWGIPSLDFHPRMSNPWDTEPRISLEWPNPGVSGIWPGPGCTEGFGSLSGFCPSSFSQCPIHSYGTWMDLPPTLPFEAPSSPVSMTSSRMISFFMNQNSIPTWNPDYSSGEEKGWERGKWISRKILDPADFRPLSFCHWNFTDQNLMDPTDPTPCPTSQIQPGFKDIPSWNLLQWGVGIREEMPLVCFHWFSSFPCNSHFSSWPSMEDRHGYKKSSLNSINFPKIPQPFNAGCLNSQIMKSPVRMIWSKVTLEKERGEEK